MTQPTLAERIAQIYELDAERTQDGWVATYAEVLCRPGRGRVSTIADCGMNAPTDEANAAFIAAAPDMVQIIRELQAENTGLLDLPIVAESCLYSNLDATLQLIEREKILMAERDALLLQNRRLREALGKACLLINSMTEATDIELVRKAAEHNIDELIAVLSDGAAS